MPSLLQNLRDLDYPQDKLDIKLVLEADDEKTLNAAKALKPEGRFDIITVPTSYPRTKPKACNYALKFCSGEFVTIYDAEDKPDPMQLKKVIAAFRVGGDKLVCIQCRLNYYNRTQNLLTALFSIEYAAWFNYMLASLDHYKLPIPLGGTSNHIYRQRLIELGEWDPYNVTEDADLGVRLSVQQFRTATLDSLTLEEAPATLWAWIKQRSRWIKGHMQTWLVHMRHPIALYKNLGAKGFWGFQFFIGGPCLVFISTPFIILSSVYLLQETMAHYTVLTNIALALSATVLVCSVLIHSFMAFIVLFHQQWTESVPAAIVFPFYWILHSLASFRGLWQLFTNPHYWDKTTHGENTNP